MKLPIFAPARFFLGCLLLLGAGSVTAGISVQDDAGRTVTLTKPAQRIVSLAPHLTEMLFAAGAGGRIVGTIEYSDYPEAAEKIPRIGSSAGLDLEAILGLRPDLIVVWKSGNPARQVERLHELGFPVYVSEPRRLADIAASIERLGKLAGTDAVAYRAAREFRVGLDALRARQGARPRVRVFYQVLDPLLITVNGQHMISDVLQLCGGENVFAGLPALAPRVDLEAVLAADPEAIIAGGTEAVWRDWLARWRAWPRLRAVQRDNLFFIPVDIVHRHGPRILQGAEAICMALEQARSRR